MRWPLTKCFSGTGSGALRPGSASSFVGMTAFLRNRAIQGPPEEMGVVRSVGTLPPQLKALAAAIAAADRTVRGPGRRSSLRPTGSRLDQVLYLLEYQGRLVACAGILMPSGHFGQGGIPIAGVGTSEADATRAPGACGRGRRSEG